MPPPVAAESAEIVTVRSLRVLVTDGRVAVLVEPAVAACWPTPLVVPKLVAPPESVHAPPTSAVPQPFTVLRSNPSCAIAFGAGAVAVTDLVAVAVPPRLSVTVRVIVYVPACA